MALTGPADGPGLGPPSPLVERLDDVAAVLAQRSGSLGTRVEIDPLVLLTERAALTGATRRGRVSCGGATRLLAGADGWLAVTLARDDDVELVPAWLHLATPPADPWGAVEEVVTTSAVGPLVAAGAALGLPVAALPGHVSSPAPSPLAALPVTATRLGDVPPAASLAGTVVADLGSLWAGPLCGSLLADAGATVVKVESTARPDGVRSGPPAVFDQLNAGMRSLALDLGAEHGRRTLAEVLSRVDVVIEGSRPRALEQLGVDASTLVRDRRPRVWVSLTGHGRGPAGRDRVGFGDDAAVAGGLVVWDGDDPCFCADAVADPASGLVAAAAVLEALAGGGRWLVDVALSGVAAHLAGPTLAVAADVRAATPARRPPRGRGPGLGEHTDEVLAELGIEP